MRSKLEDKKDIILGYIAENMSKSKIARLVGCNIKTLNRYLDSFSIEYHGKQGWSKGLNIKSRKYVPFDDYIKTCKVTTNRLRIKLIREGLKVAECERCKNTQWNGQAIPLEVHHKDGNRDNNALDNLEILCPNCHAQTPTYRGKNVKKK